MESLKVSFSDDGVTDDGRADIDCPLPGLGQFVSRVEELVILEDKTLQKRPSLTIPSFFANACQHFKDRLAFISHNSGIKIITYKDYYLKALAVAKGLMAAGLKPLEGVGFICHNSYHMFYAVMGTILAGGVYVDLYSPDNKTWLIHTMTDAKVSFAFVDTIYAKDVQTHMWDELVAMRAVVMTIPWKGQDPRVITIQELMHRGKSVNQFLLTRRLGMHAPNRCCAIFYRSNETLNEPSTPGVMMSHDNLTIMAVLISEKIMSGELGNFPDLHTRSLQMISSLPITKPAAFVLEVLLPLAVGGCVHTTKANQSMSTLCRLVRSVEPDIFCATNQVWTQLRNKLTGKARGLTSIREWVLKYAMRNMLKSHLESRKVSKLSSIVIKRVLEHLGLRKVGLFLCFGAALPQPHFEYFLSLNILIHTIREVRYLSGPPAIPLVSNTRLRVEAMGTILPEFETRMIPFGRTEASRMFVTGRHVCMGILHGSMAEQVDADGYLDTEALTMSLQGELFFVGSTRDEIVLKSGAVLSSKNVESSFKRLVPIVANCMLVGNDKKTAALLITLKTTTNPETLQSTDQLTMDVQMWCEQKLQNPCTSAQQLASMKKLHVLINGALISINRLVKRSGAWIEAYKILPRDFSIVDNEIDQFSFELNRNLILERYKDDLLTLFPKF